LFLPGPNSNLLTHNHPKKSSVQNSEKIETEIAELVPDQFQNIHNLFYHSHSQCMLIKTTLIVVVVPREKPLQPSSSTLNLFNVIVHFKRTIIEDELCLSREARGVYTILIGFTFV